MNYIDIYIYIYIHILLMHTCDIYFSQFYLLETDYKMKEIIFYYDIICPYANLASKLIEEVARRNQAKLLWRPVLLGKFRFLLIFLYNYAFLR